MKLRVIPSLIQGRVVKENIRRNYNQFLKSGRNTIMGDLPYDLDVVQQQFSNAGYLPNDYFVDIDAFNEYCLRHEKAYKDYKNIYNELFIEKALEHFVSLSFSTLTLESKVIDTANAGSPFPEIVHNDYGCDVWSNDLIFEEGIHQEEWYTRIGGDACHLPIADNFFDLMVLHCAIEMFEDEADINLIRKAEQILKPGGKIVIIPLYVNEIYHILRDPKTSRNPLPKIDSGAELVYRKDYYEVAFARFYSVNALLKRLVNHTENLKLSIYRVRNLFEIHFKCYLNWIAVLEKGT